MEIRLLKANEIECRIGTVKEGKGISLLLYKDARADQKILDETFGIMGWKREHKVMGTPVVVEEADKYGNTKQVIKGQYFSCTVSVWDKEKNEWITKEDTGNESNTDEIKGLYSDSFKRACFNLGIGRELYTSPFIWIPASKGYNKYEKFEVKEIGYNEDREINKLVIVDSKGKEAFRMGNNYSSNKNNGNNKNELLEKVYALAERKGYSKEAVNSLIAKKGFDISNFNNEAFKVMFEGYSKLEDKNKVGA